MLLKDLIVDVNKWCASRFEPVELLAETVRQRVR